MNLRDLKYLIALAEHRHFRKASEACFISQPALSMQIKKLEDSLGVQLLERTTKSVFLTDIGLTISERARHILTSVDEIKEIAKLAKDPYSGELKLGIFPTLAPYLLPHIIPKISAHFPKLALYLIEEKTETLIKKLKQGKLDAAILALPLADSELIETPLFEEEFLLTVPNNHPLAKRKTITNKNLDEETLFLLEEGHCMRAQIFNFCQRVNAIENKRFRATSLETLRHIISTGLGITLMPALAKKEKDIVTYIPFQSPKPKRKIGLCSRASSGRQLLLGEIACQIKKMMRSHTNIVIL